jgi:hypothetical protein
MKRIIMCWMGGGYKGMLSTTFARRLENYVFEHTGCMRFSEYVDLQSGCSVGSIQAGLFACGVPADVIFDVFSLHAHDVFKRNYLPWKPKYEKKPIVNMAHDLIVRYNKSGDDMQHTQTKLQINAVDVTYEDANVYFKSWKPSCQMPVSLAMQYSFSAAAFFGASVDEVNKKVYVDGGEGNSNCTLTEARIEASKLGWMATDDIYIISVGTGFVPDNLPFPEAKKKADSLLSKVWEVKEFLGMARRQALHMQIYDCIELARTNPRFTFDHVDIEIPGYLDSMDALDRVRDYIDFGNKMSEEYVPIVGDKIISIIKERKEIECKPSLS